MILNRKELFFPALLWVVLIAGCGSGKQLQCHDDQVKALVIGTLSDQMQSVVMAEAEMGNKPEVGSYSAYYLGGNPLMLDTIIQDDRDSDGAVSCEATLRATVAGFPVEAVEAQMASLSHLFALARAGGETKAQAAVDQALQEALRSKPETVQNDVASWRISYRGTHTSDGKQIVTQTANASGIGAFLGLYAIEWSAKHQ